MIQCYCVVGMRSRNSNMNELKTADLAEIALFPQTLFIARIRTLGAIAQHESEQNDGQKKRGNANDERQEKRLVEGLKFWVHQIDIPRFDFRTTA
mmetsp:Transcript_16659/g.25758  ORF Transcript_16659/g.25758 Transcript_16659/m.25758 type:complete len:95 (+) Transcript_16659:761-1045(+)